jgi:hypothetical protein
MKKIFLITFISFLLTSCATEQNYKKVLDSWMNNPENQLVSRWGAPSSSYTASNGDRILTYSSEKNASTSSITPGSFITFRCKTSFTIDGKTNYVKSYSYEGNNCRSF